MAHENINLDPVQGLIDYVNDIKPYHSKVIEALIEYVGIENVQVSIFENFDLDINFIFKFDGIFICVTGGLGGNGFGDPDTIPILSPDPSKSIIEYPAFGNGFFIVLGDQTELFDPLLNLSFRMRSFIDDKLVDVSASSGSPVTGGSFTVIGNRTVDFAIGTIFNITGSAENDGAYLSTGAIASGSPITTVISVDGQTVQTENVEGFARRSDQSNSGNFIVTTASYNRSTFTPHTTVFITGLSMTVPTFQPIDYNRRFVALADTRPLEYKKVLSYSNDLKFLGGSPPAATHTPDEGVVLTPIVNLSISPASFSVLGNYDISNVYIGDEFTIQGSTGNDGTHTITSITYHFDSIVNDYVTTFGVATIADANIDGNINFIIPSNVLVVDDDYTKIFVQGTKVNVISGSKRGIYTTLNSKFYNNSTYIRVIENLIFEGGRIIVGTSGSPADSIVVDGNVSVTYKQNQQFNIIRSLNNNGLYTTASDSVYDVVSNTTTIPILEPFNVNDTTGEIHEFTKGSLTVLATGFGETPELCEIIPATLIHVNVRERLWFNNIQMRINENIIATGFNSGQWGYELPATTVFTSTTPAVAFSNSAPASPSDGDFWFDTSQNTGSPTGPGILKQYRDLLTVAPDTSGWLEIGLGKIYWIDTNTNYLYYRIIKQYYDTAASPPNYPLPSTTNGMDSDWVLELTFIPGMNLSLAGTDAREEIAYESFFAKESPTAVADNKFSFAITGSPATQNSIPTEGSPPQARADLIEVMVNGTHANINIISPTEFEVISPRLHVGDFVEARIYDFTGTQTATYTGAWDTNAAIEENLNMLLGYSFSIAGTDAATKKIYIPDSTGAAFDIFSLGSPPDTLVEIENDTNNNGQYTIVGVTQAAGSPLTYTILEVSQPLVDTGIFTTSPIIPTGNALYKKWFQYLVVNTTVNTIIVLGDATADIINGTSIKIIYSVGSNNGTYTVNLAPTFDGRTTTISVAEAVNAGDSGCWVESI